MNKIIYQFKYNMYFYFFNDTKYITLLWTNLCKSIIKSEKVNLKSNIFSL